MKCEDCPALSDNAGYEHSADDWWCDLGEDMESGPSDDFGCMRRSLEKIKRDLKIAHEQDSKAFAQQCAEMVAYFEELEKTKINPKGESS